MGLDADLVGRRGRTTRSSWSARDAALYALGIGAGHDPADLDELRFVAEGTIAGPQAVYPMMAMAIGVDGADRPSFGDIDRSRFLHAEERLTLHAPLPLEATIELDCEAVELVDKGSGALVGWETRGRLVDGAALFTLRSSGFLRGAGGFAHRPGTSSRWGPPRAAPDAVLPLVTRPEQALIYRLSGDRNPLHSDPGTAMRGGYDRPILHGLSLLGSAARVILGSTASDLRELEARFTAPVLPGEELSVRVWSTGAESVFQVVTADGRVALDRGRLSVESW
jgi:acyl dehydratase